LLLVILIENAFKFVSSCTDKENKIEIKLTVAHGEFDFYISNTTEAILELTSPFKSGGIGVINLKRRLQLLYPEKYTLVSQHEGNCYKVNLKLELA
jgi:two-component system LytT family sensor kinase